MNLLKKTLTNYKQGIIDKQTFIKLMYEEHHAKFFDYAEYIAETNIKKIEIEDGRVVMTSRDRGIRVDCSVGDFRIAPVEILNFFDYEKEESAMMENLISDGDNFFDIGANIGWYSLNIALARRGTKVFCFEPIPKTYEQLQKNLKLNSAANIRSFNLGFSNQNGEFPFYYYQEGSGNASSVNISSRQDIQVIQCKVSTLDTYTETNKTKVDFIKCDVEGAELLVFQGGEKTIARDKPIVFSEILRKWSIKFNYNPNEIFNLFRKYNYRSFTVKNGHLVNFSSMDETTIETNFFFLHTDRHFELIQKFETTL